MLELQYLNKEKHIMKLILSTIAVAICLLISGHALGSSNQATIQSPAPAAVDASQAADNTIFQGIVKKLNEGTALFTEMNVYPLTGGDFQMIVGKEVNIIGKIVKDGNVDKISVARVQYAKN